MLARRLPTILPDMAPAESLEVTRIYSVSGLLSEHARLITGRPFRCPHHHVSIAGLIGGGAGLARPGEISLAHHGVLFLDELTLYKRDALEALRGPLEDGVVRIARSGGAVTYPCRFSLIAAMNPCGCGFMGDPSRRCRCSDDQVMKYRSKLSGPLVDRLDLQALVERPTRSELLGAPTGESSGDIKERVTQARDIQVLRFGDPTVTNASAERRRLDATVQLTPGALSELSDSVERFSLSGRAVDRALRVARTSADLRGSPVVDQRDMVEAIGFRLFDLRQGVAA